IIARSCGGCSLNQPRRDRMVLARETGPPDVSRTATRVVTDAVPGQRLFRRPGHGNRRTSRSPSHVDEATDVLREQLVDEAIGEPEHLERVGVLAVLALLVGALVGEHQVRRLRGQWVSGAVVERAESRHGVVSDLLVRYVDDAIVEREIVAQPQVAVQQAGEPFEDVNSWSPLFMSGK